MMKCSIEGRGCQVGREGSWGGVDFSVGGIYISPSPKRGRPPRCAPARSWKETPCVPFLDKCPKTDVPFQDTRSPARRGKANEYVCQAVGMACASIYSHMITDTTTTTTTTTTLRFRAELTDTFGGEANYSWVRRAEIEAPADISDLALVRRAKAALGLSGVRCERSNHGDMLELRPYGSCTVMFISAAY
jgi:hypothetical protein